MKIEGTITQLDALQEFPDLKFVQNPEIGDDNSMEIMNTLMEPFFDKLNIKLTDTQWAELHDRYLASTKFLVKVRKEWAENRKDKDGTD